MTDGAINGLDGVPFNTDNQLVSWLASEHAVFHGGFLSVKFCQRVGLLVSGLWFLLIISLCLWQNLRRYTTVGVGKWRNWP